MFEFNHRLIFFLVSVVLVKHNLLSYFQYRPFIFYVFKNISQKCSCVVIVILAYYIILASNRNYGPVYKNLSLFPYSTRYYSSLFDGTLGYKLVFGETRYPTVAGRSMRGDPIMSLGIDFAESEIYGDVLHRSSVSDESFTVYDHPLVLIFYNESRLSFDELMDVVSQ